jgi:hypothetical protein
MSKKHFIKAAEFIKLSGKSKAAKTAMAELIAAINDTPSFDKQRFLTACGLN